MTAHGQRSGSFTWPSLGPEALREAAAEAREAGLEEGRKAGYEEGMARAGEEIDALRKSSMESLEAIAAARLELQRQNATRLGELIHMLCSALILDELRHRPEVVVGLVERAIESIDGDGRDAIEIHAHPQLVEQLSGVEGVRVVAEPGLASGAFAVRTADETVSVEPLAVIDRWLADTVHDA